MKLVNIHKRTLVILLVLGWNSVLGQTWTLDRCIDTALMHNKNLMTGRNDILRSLEKQKEVAANLLPVLSVKSEYKYFMDLPYQFMPMSAFNPAAPEGEYMKARFGVPHNLNANLQLNLPLYDARLYGAKENTKIATEISTLQYHKTEEQLYYDITNLYYNAQLLQHQLLFIEANRSNSEKLLKNMKLLRENLLAKGTDVSRVQLQLTQLNNQKEKVSSQYDQALNVLKFLMGVSLDEEVEIVSQIEYKDGFNYTEGAITDLQLLRTKNRLLLNEVKILKKTQFLPTLGLFASYGTNGFGYDKKPNDFLKFYPVGLAGLQISFPLFNGTAINRQISQKKLEITNNELQIQLTKGQIAMQTVNVLRQLNVARNSITVGENQIDLAQTIYEQTLLQQTQGTASLTDVLSADTELRNAQQAYLSNVVEYLKADLELKKITGNISKNK